MPDGTTYLTLNDSEDSWIRQQGHLIKISADGIVILNKLISDNVFGLTKGAADSIWVLTSEGATRFDQNGNAMRTLTGVYGSAITSDPAGGFYVASQFRDGGTIRLQLSRFDATGDLIVSLTGDADTTPNALAIDSAGDIYVAGRTKNQRFQTTTGALVQSNPDMFGREKAFVMKVSSKLDRVIYATLLTDIRFDDASALAVDDQGNAYIGGYATYDETAFPLTALGMMDAFKFGDVAYLVKLNASGSALVYGVGLCPGAVTSIALDPSGAVHVVAVSLLDRTYYGALFTVNSSGNGIERQQLLNGALTFVPTYYLAGRILGLLMGRDHSLRVVAHISSSRFPVLDQENLPPSPVLIDLPQVVHEANLSLESAVSQPFIPGGDFAVQIRVTNHGPEEAEAVKILGPSIDFATPLTCSADRPVVCQRGTFDAAALLPKLPAGESVVLTFAYRYSAVTSLTELQPVFRTISLTSDVTWSNNNITVRLPIARGYYAGIAATPRDLEYERQDNRRRCDSNCMIYGGTASPSVAVSVPSPQRRFGNLWHFDSWADGNTDNPRTFDGSAGIPVSQGVFQMTPALPIGLDPPSLDFVVLPGRAPAAASVTLHWTSSPGTFTVANPKASWLILGGVRTRVDLQAILDQSATVSATVDVTGLPPGFYKSSFTARLVPSRGPTVEQDVPVTLRIMDAAPSIVPGGIVSAATNRTGPLSSGQIISIYGSGLGPDEAEAAPLPKGGEMPTRLGGTRVLIEGLPAYLLYVGSSQIVAIVPSLHSITNPGKTKAVPFEIEIGGTVAISQNVDIGLWAPELLTQSNRVIAVNADGSPNSPDTPAERGSTVTLYATGIASQGLNDFPSTCWLNEFASNLPALVKRPLEVMIGGRPAVVLYAGSAEGLPCAIEAVRVLIDEGSDVGSNVPITLSLLEYTGTYWYAPPYWYTSPPVGTIAIR